VRDCFNFPSGRGPTPHQLRILRNLHKEGREAARGCHGIGKTAICAWAVLHFALTRELAGVDWKCITTASAFRQLSAYLWPEIHKWQRRLRWGVVGRPPFGPDELLDQAIKLRLGMAIAASTHDKDLIEGAHETELLYVLDEAKAIPDVIWDAVEGAFSTGNPLALAVSTPGAAAGRFYQIHQRRPGYEDWHAEHVKTAEAVASGLVNPKWCEQRRKQWGEDSPVYRSRVLGEFAETGERTLIPLAWVELAQQRWLDSADEMERMATDKWSYLGVDVARSGADEICMAALVGQAIVKLDAWHKDSTMVTTGRVMAFLRDHGGRAVVDAEGVGAGVFDRLRENGADVVAFVAGSRPFADVKDNADEHGARRYLNLRARAWWAMREKLDPDNMCGVSLPPDDALTADLTTPRWSVTSVGAVKVESKDEIRERLGRSPDRGDAVVMAFAGAWLEGAPELEFL
jgi:hypothetical protein